VLVDTIDKQDIRARYMNVDSSNVADVLDELGLGHQGLAPEFVPYSGERIAGWAYTISGESGAYDGTGDPRKMEACSGIGPGEVSVWSGDGGGVCYFGELIALGMAERGSAGALVDGGVRDLRWLRRRNFPLFARYRSPVQSIGRWRVTSWQEPAPVRGATSQWVTVRPGDFILGDEDGCICVPQEVAGEVLARAEQLTRTEVEIRAALDSGVPLGECLRRYGHV
jgi:4-hydroxy-4-methyl-2-oxoglutarate aldolase